MTNLFDLCGKVALVTGGNGGIGLGIARGLAQAGANIVIWGRNADKLADARAQLKAYGVRVMAQQVDVSGEDAVTGAYRAAITEMGRVDSVFANAGGADTRPFATLTNDEWRQVLATNLDSVFWLFREACRHMQQTAESGHGGGSLVAISSVAAIRPPARGQAYAAAKAGTVALVKSIAAEYGHLGIRANAILPGFVRSDLSAHLQDMDAFTQKVIHGRVPARRWGEPEDFAGIAVYLASDRSSFHTADTFVIDGGFANS